MKLSLTHIFTLLPHNHWTDHVFPPVSARRPRHEHQHYEEVAGGGEGAHHQLVLSPGPGPGTLAPGEDVSILSDPEQEEHDQNENLKWNAELLATECCFVIPIQLIWARISEKKDFLLRIPWQEAYNIYRDNVDCWLHVLSWIEVDN